MRNVLVHYHLFKNAGSSIDAILKKSFADDWMAFDPNCPPSLYTSVDLAKIIEENATKVAFSSHCIVPPLPTGQFSVFPIVVLRDPIARVMSAYIFEWKKQLELEEPKGSLAEYIHDKFSKARANAIEDFQSFRLSVVDETRVSPIKGLADASILQAAIEFISELPVFGIVEQFDVSLDLFSYSYGSVFPDLKFEHVAHNVTQGTDIPMHVRYEKIRSNIGGELFDELILRNQMDIKLYSYALGRFSEISKALPDKCLEKKRRMVGRQNASI